MGSKICRKNTPSPSLKCVITFHKPTRKLNSFTNKPLHTYPLTVLNMKNGELTKGMRPASPRVSAGVGANRRFSRSLPIVGSLFPHFDISPWRCKLVEKPEEVWMNGVLSAMLTSLLFRATYRPKGNIFWQICNEMHSNQMTDPQMYFC